MRHEGVDSLERQRAVVRWLLLLLLAVSPLPFGSVQSWAVLALELSAAAIFGLACLVLARDPDGLPRNTLRVLIPAGLVGCVGLLQLVPLPGALAGLAGSPAARVRQAVAAVAPDLVPAAAPWSLEPPATVDAVLRWTTYVLLGLSVVVAVRRRSHVRQVFLVLAVSGTFQALYGAVEYLSGHQHIFAFAKQAYEDEASGTFINRNHFAGYLAMVLPLALGLAITGGRKLVPPVGWRARLVALTETPGLIRLAGALAAVAIWAGVILSYSRGGLAVALLVTGIVAGTTGTRQRRARVVALIVMIPVLWLLAQDVREPGERFLTAKSAVGDRLTVWRTSLVSVRENPILGTGLGTFEPAFALARTAPLEHRWDHAHNEWLQLAFEGGLLGLSAALVALWALLAGMMRREGSRRFRAEGLTACVLAAVVGAAVHAMIDFSLRIPANAVVLATLVGLGVVCASFERSGVVAGPGVDRVASGPFRRLG